MIENESDHTFMLKLVKVYNSSIKNSFGLSWF